MMSDWYSTFVFSFFRLVLNFGQLGPVSILNIVETRTGLPVEILSCISRVFTEVRTDQKALNVKC